MSTMSAFIRFWQASKASSKHSSCSRRRRGGEIPLSLGLHPGATVGQPFDDNVLARKSPDDWTKPPELFIPEDPICLLLAWRPSTLVTST